MAPSTRSSNPRAKRSGGRTTPKGTRPPGVTGHDEHGHGPRPAAEHAPRTQAGRPPTTPPPATRTGRRGDR